MTVEQAAKVISHPLRSKLLQAYSDGVTSPSDLASDLGEPIGNVSYHTRMLASAGAIGLTETKQVRGALEHYYRSTFEGDRALELLAVWAAPVRLEEVTAP